MTFKAEKQKVKNTDNTSFAKLFKAVILGFKIIFWEWRVFLFSAVNCCLTIGNEVATWHIYEINGQFARALASSDYDLFIACAWAGLKSAAMRSSIDTIRALSADLCNIVYRRNAIEQAHRKYFRYETYFRLNAVDKEGVDNPDQRITTDVSAICGFYAGVLIPTMTSTLVVTIYFTHKIYRIANWEGITILYALAILSVLVNLVFVKPVGTWTNRIEKSEGWFRYKHCTIRDNAESTAMYDASKFENKECMRLVDQIMMKNLWLGCWQFLQQPLTITLCSNIHYLSSHASLAQPVFGKCNPTSHDCTYFDNKCHNLSAF
uniref:ABC transmembrane type-1 domain-containing protein n=1 Tax=Panagrellus redivivus TaxID=6233 RepID=A0A7E4UMB5_PANRE